ncbi:MAG TPA: hypothetical protein VGJ13_00045 [Pseudonocardiaceae bacterium]|jgi:uncharacterized membrane protein
MSSPESYRPGSADQRATTGPPTGSRPADQPGQVQQHHLRALAAVREELAHLEEALCASFDRTRDAAHNVHVPAWLRTTRGESRWPVAVVIVIAIALQVALPDQLVLQSRWLLPGLELALLVVLIVVNPTRFNRESRTLRAGGLTLTGVLALANAWSAILLVLGLVEGRGSQDAVALLATGAAIWLTNIIVFALGYWEFDRGGPAARANARHTVPDFLFVQMQNPELADPEWEPEFVDYLYLSFTNATAFSPTDVMPLSRWAKLIMLAQSAVSLVTLALVIARAVNVLK